VNDYRAPALRLLAYLKGACWTGQALYGPDPIGKVNWRVTRFIKGYTPWLPWKDRFAYTQAQGYWIKALARLCEMDDNPQSLEMISSTANYLVSQQLPGGAWEHPPLRERKGFISTVETTWACLGLATAYRQTGDARYRQSLIHGYDGLSEVIGFQQVQDGLAVNYHAHTHQAIPNVTNMLLWLKAELYKVTGEAMFLEHQDAMLHFLEISQLDSGEFSYIYEEKPHFQCFQYNSFEFIDLVNFYLLTANQRILPILARLAKFLSGGLTSRNSCRYNCFRDNPETYYWNAALATALWIADQLDLGPYRALSERLYERLLSRQKADGSFEFSERNYGFLADHRSYPRQQAMILYFLLTRAGDRYTVI